MSVGLAVATLITTGCPATALLSSEAAAPITAKTGIATAPSEWAMGGWSAEFRKPVGPVMQASNATRSN